MKKNTLKRAFAALAVSAVAASASAVSAIAAGPAAGQEYNLNGLDPSKAATKPTLSLTQEKISLEEAKANPTRTIELTVSGAAGKYAPTGLHIDYDERLKIVEDGGFYADLGPAGKRLSQEQQGDGTHGFFVATAASSDAGQDGVLWTFQLTLPSDVKGGDKFPIEIAYRSKQSAEDLFTNGDKDLTGKEVVVVGRSLVVGKPLAMMLLAKNATVTICHTKTKDMAEVTRRADIVIVAAGKAGVIGKEHVREGQIVIDVGINVDENGKLCGDVRFDEVSEVVDAITPVPGGVGGVTTSILASHLL